MTSGDVKYVLFRHAKHVDIVIMACADSADMCDSLRMSGGCSGSNMELTEESVQTHRFNVTLVTHPPASETFRLTHCRYSDLQVLLFTTCSIHRSSRGSAGGYSSQRVVTQRQI